MKHAFSHDDLVRYVDGELDADEARAIEAAAADDPSMRAVIRDLSEGAALLRAAFSEPLHASATDELSTRIAARLAEARAPAATVVPIAPRRRWYVPAAVAASVAIVALGLGGGYFVADSRIDAARTQLAAQHLEDQKAFELALNQALEKQVSGQSVSWRNPESGRGGTVTPIRTFKSASGEWCREYAYEAAGEAGTETLHAVACRAAEGRWLTRVPAQVQS